VQLYEHADARRTRELGAFARYCVSRIEHDLGEAERWLVKVTPTVGGFTSLVAVQDNDYSAEAVAYGFDGALAIWDAMCRLEQGLREARAQRVERLRAAMFEAEG
jgi:hypothetical protein